MATPSGASSAVVSRAEAKAALRKRVRAGRRARSAEQQQADGAALALVVCELPEVARARCVTLYASLPGEPSTVALRAALAQAGVRVLLPLVTGREPLDWAEDDGALVDVGGIGGPEPSGPRLGPDAVRQADVLLIPGLAVDTLGHRLGQGAAFYDRALALVDPATPVIALLHEDEVFDAAVEPIPVEDHDRSVDAVATPRRCLRVG